MCTTDNFDFTSSPWDKVREVLANDWYNIRKGEKIALVCHDGWRIQMNEVGKKERRGF